MRVPVRGKVEIHPVKVPHVAPHYAHPPGTVSLGATAFFWCYCVFEIPSNIVLEKIGARIWIAGIMHCGQ